MPPPNPQLMEALLGTVLSSEGAAPQGLPQPALQSQAEPLSDLEVIIQQLQPTSPEPLTKGQRIAGGFADAIGGLLAVSRGIPRGPSALSGPIAANKAEADRINQANLRKAQIALGKQAFDRREGSKVDAENRRNAREDAAIAAKVAEGEAAEASDMERLRVAFGIEEPFDQSNPLSAGRIRGLAMKRQMEMERENKFASTRNRTAEDEAKADAKFEEQFLGELDQMEFNADTGQLFENVGNPADIRRSFYRRVKRRASPETADRLIREFERVVGPEINKAIMEANEARRKEQGPSIGGAAAALSGGETTGSGVLQTIPNMGFGLPGADLNVFQDLLNVLRVGGDVAKRPADAREP